MGDDDVVAVGNHTELVRGEALEQGDVLGRHLPPVDDDPLHAGRVGVAWLTTRALQMLAAGLLLTSPA